MPPAASERLYLDDSHALAADAVVVAVREGAVALDRTCFYPGGGGQPPDEGALCLQDGAQLRIASAHADDAGAIWHAGVAPLPEALAGQRVRVQVDAPRRDALARYHTVLHILNTITLRDYGGWITGAQIAVDYSRIDFKLDGFSAQMRSDLEGKVNEVIAAAHPVRSYALDEAEFNRRGDLLRTLEVKPPMHHGCVRIIEIEGFDAQACGGTHVRNTERIGAFRIERSENKGKINKRLYVRLDPGPGRG